MLAFGIIGFIAGCISSLLKKQKMFLLTYGVLSGLVYSLVMDVWTVIWYNGSFNPGLYLTAVFTALPHTVLYAASNFVFIFFMANPFGDKLERIKIKYGL